MNKIVKNYLEERAHWQASLLEEVSALQEKIASWSEYRPLVDYIFELEAVLEYFIEEEKRDGAGKV